MKRLSCFILVLMTLLPCTAQTKSILVLTERGGQHGPFTDTALEWLRAQGEKNCFSITEINSTRPVTLEYLQGFDTMIQLDFPPYTWTDGEKRAFEKYIEEGHGGWIGFHHASLLGDFDGYSMWQWFSGFMGGIVYRNYIAELTDGNIVVEDAGHPVMTGVRDGFTVPDDEFYIYDKSPRPKVRVLASVDEDSYTTETSVKMGDHPVVWTNEAVNSRNVYIQMGHSPRLFESEDFCTLFLNAIRWTSGIGL